MFEIKSLYLMPTCIAFLWTLDSSIGKVSKESLSRMTLMELFSQHITNRENIHCDIDTADDISSWTGVILHENSDILEIRWYALRFQTPLDGSVALEWLPLTVKILILWGNHLQGTVCLIHLPDCLQTLNLSANNFSGPLDFENLPTSLVDLYLQDNPFVGSISLSSLPHQFERLNVGNTDLYGEVDFDSLPETLVLLDVSNTKLSGVLCSSYGENFHSEGSDVIVVDL